MTALAPWFAFLLARARPAEGRHLSDFALAGHDLDLTPFNLVETEAGLVPIDREWRIDGDIPLGFVVTRAVFHSLRGIAGFERDAVTLADVIGALCARHGLQVDDGEIAAWLRRESELQELCGGRPLSGHVGSLASRQRVPMTDPNFHQHARIVALTETVATLQTKIEQIYQSRSWRYSYPLRLAGQLLRGGSLAKAARPDAGGMALSPRASAGGVARRSGRVGRLRAVLGPRLVPYGCAALAVFVAFAITYLLTASGIRTPRMLLYIAAVAVAARFGGGGPGVFALGLSVAAILLSAPSLSHFMHDIVRVERLGFFLICAAIGILVSIPRRDEPSARHRSAAP